MRAVLADLSRLVLLLLLLPVILILLGPLLVLAVLRGRQPAGPLTLNTTCYGPAGRAGTFLLGLLIWAVVWIGLGWLSMAALTPLPAAATLSLAATATWTPTATVIAPTPTPTRPPATARPTPTATKVALIATKPVPTPAPSPTPRPSPTASATATPTLTPVPTVTPVPVTETSTPTPTTRPPLTYNERQAAIAAVEEGNVLLREAMTSASDENLQKLETVWHDTALAVARKFARELASRYARPFSVSFEYMTRPVFNSQKPTNEVVIVSREVWRYGGPTRIDEEEAFEFIYTLLEIDGRWVITHYTYRNLPLPPPTPTPTPSATPVPAASETPEA